MNIYVYFNIFMGLFMASANVVADQSLTSEDSDRATALFAGGCFWCMEKPFDKLKGVLETTSGYSGGKQKDPTYKSVSAGGTGHFEVLQVTYDPTRVSYEKLLEVFWVNVDPTDAKGQFCDKGLQYRTAIFINSEDQKDAAEESLKKIKQEKSFSADIVTPILQAARFYSAEEYHQDYYKKNPVRYNYYRYSCGRDKRLAELWGEK